LLNLLPQETGEVFRQIFLARFTLEAHLTKLAEALVTVEQPEPFAVAAIASVAR